MGGSADLAASNLTLWSGSKPVTRTGGGNYLFYGVREFGMCAIANGLALHGGLIPHAATFLVFSDQHAERLAVPVAERPVPAHGDPALVQRAGLDLEHVLGGPRILIKRDDQTGLAFGGNKSRKLEFLLAEAKAKRADTLITAGAVQSNHCRQTAAAAARCGLRCLLVLYGDKPEKKTANLMLDELFNAEIVWTDRAHRDEVLQQTYAQAENQGHRPYLAPYGGSSPTGALGYVFAIEELVQQGFDRRWDREEGSKHAVSTA